MFLAHYILLLYVGRVLKLCSNFVPIIRKSDHGAHPCIDAHNFLQGLNNKLRSTQPLSNESQILPPIRQFIPPAKVTFALVISEPPILVHFIPTNTRIDPKRARIMQIMMRARHIWMSPVRGQKHTRCSFIFIVFHYILSFTYSSVQALMGSLCSPMLPWNQKYSPSTGWRRSLPWSGLKCQLRTKSRSRSALWNKQGSIRLHTPQSNQSQCTSPQSCNPCWLRYSEKRQKTDKS